nr:hypothetical protein [Candidatus Korarchaeota archaeon]NIU82397.1 hypothetical protein [Candidatus Thorarchaeota archaeon]NIW12870.1 hypothetical protein [Candidatus Thorarchaeota archaeon]NIW51064.1 hypothetical protein [Candidatus Korarchaeota archaeon]
MVLIARAHKAAADDYEDLGGQITALREWAEEEDDEEEEIREGLRRLYLEGGKLTVKTYGPGFFMGAASLGLILASHGLMRQRNQALLATMAVIERSFSTYRGRVITELGEEA